MREYNDLTPSAFASKRTLAREIYVSLRLYHYDAKTALEELQEDALLPHPVKLRDMILRIQLGPQDAQLMNSEFQDYLTRFGELQRVARGILEKLAAGKAKN